MNGTGSRSNYHQQAESHVSCPQSCIHLSLDSASTASSAPAERSRVTSTMVLRWVVAAGATVAAEPKSSDAAADLFVESAAAVGWATEMLTSIISVVPVRDAGRVVSDTTAAVLTVWFLLLTALGM